jgi:hypothetical protein
MFPPVDLAKGLAKGSVGRILSAAIGGRNHPNECAAWSER